MQTLFTLHFATGSFSIFFDERCRKEIPLLLFQTSTQASSFTALQHFLLLDWSPSSIVFTGIIFFADPFTHLTGLQFFAALHSFNWSSTLRNSPLLQMVFTESIASTSLHCFNWSFRQWSFANRIECFKLI